MPKKQLVPESLSFQPRPAFPYSPGAAAGGFIYTAGQVAWGPDGELVAIGDIRGQTRQTLQNVLAVLTEGGAKPSDVLKCNVYLANIERDFQAMNEEFAKVFPDAPPARTTVQAPMASPEMLVEIEAIAYIGQ